jgi:hypothetical protein
VDVANTRGKDGFCKPSAAFKIRQHCQLLCQAYAFALAWMNQQLDNEGLNKTWKECYGAAWEYLSPCRNEATATSETIAKWKSGIGMIDTFLHPNPTVRSGKRSEPSLFEHFPESKDAVRRFANGNLADSMTELKRDFIVTKILPDLLNNKAIHHACKYLLTFYIEKWPVTLTLWQ